jgi:hypothetical protein
MTIIAILASVGLLYFILEPLSVATVEDDSGAARSAESEHRDASRRDASARLEAALLEIIDLEADFESGKMAREDYEQARAEVERKAARDLDC